MSHMGIFNSGSGLRALRQIRGLSQSKLAELTGIVQARISAYELGKNGLKEDEKATIQAVISGLDEDAIRQLKSKRYRSHKRTGSIIASRPRRSYCKTSGNSEYLQVLAELEAHVLKQKDNCNVSPKALSLFAGCGGLCYGVKAAGFRIVGASEIYDGFRDIYTLNFPEVPILTSDVRKISDTECAQIIEREGQIALMAGGPPCQGFSLTGKRDPEDARNTLFYDYLRIANNIRPKVILMENVRLLTSMKNPEGRLVTDCILEAFSDIGYNAEFFCINAKDYGVPQHRERVIFIATEKLLCKTPSIPPATHGNESAVFDCLKPFRTFGDAVSDLEFIESGETSLNDKWHFAVSHPEHVIEWLVDVPQGSSAHNNKDPEMRPPSGYNTTYKRQVWNEPGSTVSTTFAMISGCRNVHPIATRSITIREAMRLQSFPDSFMLGGRIGDIRTALGNAVPPLLGYVLASHIMHCYIL
jgi:DNA (cytosine-5)-methyltransferase 1